MPTGMHFKNPAEVFGTRRLHKATLRYERHPESKLSKGLDTLHSEAQSPGRKDSDTDTIVTEGQAVVESQGNIESGEYDVEPDEESKLREDVLTKLDIFVKLLEEDDPVPDTTRSIRLPNARPVGEFLPRRLRPHC